MKIQDILKMRSLAVLFTGILLYSCSGDKEVNIPENVLSIEKMGLIMMDMHLMEASMNLNISNAVSIGNGSDLKTTALELLKKNNVTKEQYQNSFAFYTEHPALFAEVYKLVLNNLSQLQAKVANEKEPVKKDSVKKDSIRKDPIKKRIKPIKKP